MLPYKLCEKLFKQYSSYPNQAASLFAKVDIERGEKLLEYAINDLLKARDCGEKVAHLLLNCIKLLTTSYRKQEKSFESQLLWLEEALSLLEKFPLPIPEGRDRDVNFPYEICLNFAITANKMRLPEKEAKGLRAAYQVARDYETKAKAIIFLIKSLVVQDTAKSITEAKNLLPNAQKLLEADGYMPFILKGLFFIAKASIEIKKGTFSEAKRILYEALSHLPNDPILLSIVELVSDANKAEREEVLTKIKAILETGAIRQEKGTLPLLPKDFLETIQYDFLEKEMRKNPLSDYENTQLARFGNLAKKGDYQSLEKLLRSEIANHNFIDRYYARLLEILAQALLGLGNVIEALPIIDKAIVIAYSLPDKNLLILNLDRRSEILCFKGEFSEALRTLKIATNYLNTGIENQAYLQARVNHTYGMIYTGCAWWEMAKEKLEQAIDFSSYNRLKEDEVRARGDFVHLILTKAESEKVSKNELKKAIGFIPRMKAVFQELGNHPLEIKATLDGYSLQTYQAIYSNDIEQLGIIRMQHDQLVYQLGSTFFSQPAHTSYLTAAQKTAFLMDKYGIEANMFQYPMEEVLNPLLNALSSGLTVAPEDSNQWFLKAQVHLLIVKQNFGKRSFHLMKTAWCLEQVVKIYQSAISRFSDSKLRAFQQFQTKPVIQCLADTAFYLLKEGRKFKNHAKKMIELAQSLEGKRRQDISRTTFDHRNPYLLPDKEKTLLSKIETLSQWLYISQMIERYKDSEKENLRKEIKTLREKAIQLDATYSLLNNSELIEKELNRCKEKLDREVESGRTIKEDWHSITPIQSIQKKLKSGEYVIDYFLGLESQYVCVIGSDKFSIFPLSPNSEMTESLSSLHQGITETGRSSLSEFRDRVRQLPQRKKLKIVLEQGGKWLFPLEVKHTLKKADRLHIIVKGILYQIPFAFLRIDNQFLIEKWELSLMPSIQLFRVNEKFNPTEQVVGVGNPGEPPLFLVKEEVSLIQEIFNGKVYFPNTGHIPTPENILKEVLPHAGLIHFASHSKSDKLSPLFSSLYLAKANTFSKGSLFLHQILQTPVSANLVNIFSCHSAQNAGPLAFPESLALGFLAAGARYVIAARWAVLDEDCLSFATDLFRKLKEGANPIAAYKFASIEHLEKILGRKSEINWVGVSDDELFRLCGFMLVGG